MGSSASDVPGGPPGGVPGADPSVALPRVGLTTYAERARWGAWDRRAALLPYGYVEAVTRAGGLPVLLPPPPVADGERRAAVASALDGVDGIVLSGGADVDPARYGATSHAATGEPDRDRDTWEAALAEAALARDLPLLGLCRGAQVVAAVLGGTLHQHLPERVGHEGHRPAPGTFGPVDVRLAEGSRLHAALGPRVTVSCSHHQALDRVPAGAVTVGWADDGTVEAYELPGHRFAVGVQWHPEERGDGAPAVLTALVRAADEGALPTTRAAASGRPGPEPATTRSAP